MIGRSAPRCCAFALVSLVGTAIDFLVLWLLHTRFGLNVVLASLISTEASILNSFIWNQLWAFRGRAGRGGFFSRLLTFNGLYASMIVITLVIVGGLTALFGSRYYLIYKAITLPVNFVWTYLWSTLFLWRRGSSRVTRWHSRGPNSATVRKNAAYQPCLHTGFSNEKSRGRVVMAVNKQQEVQDVFEPLVEEGEAELQRPLLDLTISGLIGGLDIGFGPLAMGVVTGRLHAAFHLTIEAALFWGNFLYPLGFVIVIMGKAELFTENTLTPVAGLLSGVGSLDKLLRRWAIILATNIACRSTTRLLARSRCCWRCLPGRRLPGAAGLPRFSPRGPGQHHWRRHLCDLLSRLPGPHRLSSTVTAAIRHAGHQAAVYYILVPAQLLNPRLYTPAYSVYSEPFCVSVIRSTHHRS